MRTIVLFLLSVALIAMPTSPAFAQRSLSEAGLAPATPQEALDQSSQTAPVDLDALRQQADAGDQDAQYQLGVALLLGNGVDKDAKAGLALLGKAAESGVMMAALIAGFEYQNGGSVPIDGEQAVHFYTLAANGGDPGAAAVNLGMIYEEGLGAVRPDDEKAALWYQRAAEYDNGVALHRLGVMYQVGTSAVAKDINRAIEFYKAAMAQGEAEAASSLGFLYLQGEDIPQDLVEAQAYMRAGARANNIKALEGLAIMYQSALGVSLNFPKAAWLYRQAIFMGETRPEAMGWRDEALAQAASLGTVDELKAKVAQGDMGAALTLAQMYEVGIVAPLDIAEAAYYYRFAWENGNAEASKSGNDFWIENRDIYLDILKFKAEQTGEARFQYTYAEEAGTAGNFQDRLEWDLKAAEQGYAPAQASLGLLYEVGGGPPEQDLEKARYYYELAAAQGNQFATTKLATLEAAPPPAPPPGPPPPPAPDTGSGLSIEELTAKADAGDAAAQYELGLKYVHGDGVAKDFKKGRLLLRLSALQNYPGAMDVLTEIGDGP